MNGQDLTGVWNADDRGTYYITQIGNNVFWASLSGDGGFNNGLSFCNVFAGQIQGEFLVGDWADVPRGLTLSSGTLNLRITANGPIELVRVSETGGFGGSSWEPADPVPPVPPSSDPPLRDRLDATYKNVANDLGLSHETLLDNLKGYHDYVVIVGTVRIDSGQESFRDPPHINLDRSYNGFMCQHMCGVDDEDADFSLSVAIDINQLNNLGPPDKLVSMGSPDFWNDGGWFYTNEQPPNGGIPQKFNFFQQSTRLNFIHCEAIMYGRATDECDGNGEIMFPGWMETGGNSVLLNSQPIAGQITESQGVLRLPINGNCFNIGIGTKLRINGALVLDCGHNDCNEDDPTYQNQEIHPVYSIDIIQDFTKPRPNADLSGVWNGPHGETYYVRQIGLNFWALALSRDRGQTFSEVYKGTVLTNNTVCGDFVSVRLGAEFIAGKFLFTCDSGDKSTVFEYTLNDLSTAKINKLYDIPYR